MKWFVIFLFFIFLFFKKIIFYVFFSVAYNTRLPSSMSAFFSINKIFSIILFFPLFFSIFSCIEFQISSKQICEKKCKKKSNDIVLWIIFFSMNCMSIYRNGEKGERSYYVLSNVLGELLVNFIHEMDICCWQSQCCIQQSEYPLWYPGLAELHYASALIWFFLMGNVKILKVIKIINNIPP